MHAGTEPLRPSSKADAHLARYLLKELLLLERLLLRERLLLLKLLLL